MKNIKKFEKRLRKIIPEKCERCLWKKKIIKKKTTTAQIRRLENTEHNSMKQVLYSGKCSLSASRAHHSLL